MVELTKDMVRRMPKVALHEHLDGGLRPATVIELARDQDVTLPSDDPDTLREWFERGANRGSLAEYLEGFAVTCGVMQTEAALERVAYEALEDLQADGVAYAELRFAPQFHCEKALQLEPVMDAVLRGMERAGNDHDIRWGLIVCGMRGSPPTLSLKMAELAIAFRDRGCVGFDLAGDEFGHPPKEHLDAFYLCQRESFNITIHSGEAFGVPSIWQALQYCGAHRIGHGTRLIEDMVIQNDEVLRMGRLAQYVLDHRIPLEICLSSNVQTGAVASLDEHPFRYLLRHNFRITLNTDNRLMSGTTCTEEHWLAHQHFGVDLKGLEKIVINGMKSAFIRYDHRCEIIYDSLKPGFARLRSDLGLDPTRYPA
ncbi:MAG: adenosine deaminase [Planctomycetota bacterium]|nr:adenosine deaminase [Planctomycetota bacterium]